MDFLDIQQKTDTAVLKTYGRFPLAFEKGEGAYLTAVDGKTYLDFNSGLGVNALGHCHPKVVGLVKKQAEMVYHTSNLYHIPSQSVLAEKICSTCFGERVFFCNSGAEAVEGALKFARKWGTAFDPKKTEIIAFANSFHGRTFGSLSATMQDKYQNGFAPLVPGFKKAVFNDIESVKALVTEYTAAVIIEPLQGEGGVNPAEKEFMSSLENLCREKNMLLIVDEVQCGMGRTGKLFAYEHYNIEPDIMTLAKPLAGGLPIGATVVGPRIWSAILPGEHASTFGGNHFVTGVASGVFDLIADDDFVNEVAEKSNYMFENLHVIAEKFSCIKDVRGIGLLIGVEVDFPSIDAVNYFQDKGILICPAGPNVVRFIPPLIVTKNDIDRVLDTFDSFLSEKCE